ncbi:MAG TPA: CopD family protein [Candidatus Eisenbacteria bacterium]
MVESEPLIRWPQPIVEFVGFAALFLASGAVGFRYAVAGRVGGAASEAGERSVLAAAARRAAGLGLAGAVLGAALFIRVLPQLAARRHLAVGPLLAGSPPLALQAILMLAAIVGFTIALAGRGAGWPLAAVGVIAGALRMAFFAQWTRLVNPLHMLAGGLWIGTLFVLVTAGFGAARRGALPDERRVALMTRMVNAFSPLALSAVPVLAAFGLVTAWTHLHAIRALWTTPYGVTLIVKLCVVAVVLALGAWNWRRQKRRMDSDAGAAALQRSARAELAVAAVVLAVTAVLVSLPSPRG